MVDAKQWEQTKGHIVGMNPMAAQKPIAAYILIVQSTDGLMTAVSNLEPDQLPDFLLTFVDMI